MASPLRPRAPPQDYRFVNANSCSRPVQSLSTLGREAHKPHETVGAPTLLKPRELFFSDLSSALYVFTYVQVQNTLALAI